MRDSRILRLLAVLCAALCLARCGGAEAAASKSRKKAAAQQTPAQTSGSVLPKKGDIAVIADGGDFTALAEERLENALRGHGYRVVDEATMKKVRAAAAKAQAVRLALLGDVDGLLKIRSGYNAAATVLVQVNAGQPRENSIKAFTGTASVVLRVLTPNGVKLGGVDANAKKIGHTQDETQGKAVHAALQDAIAQLFGEARPQTAVQRPEGPEVDAEEDTRPRLTVRAFEDKSQENAPAAAVMDMMITELDRTKIFELIEREKIGYALDELRMAEEGLLDPRTAPKTGKIRSPQYSMTGAITGYHYEEKGGGTWLAFIGGVAAARTAYVALDLRVIDTVTTETIYTAQQVGTSKEELKGWGIYYGGFGLGKYDRKYGGVLAAATHDAVLKHVEELKKHPWR